MVDVAENQERPKPRSWLAMLVGLMLAAGLGTGGFLMARSGQIPALWVVADAGTAPLPDVAFVPVSPIVVSLQEDAGARHLRFGATLEVERIHQAEVTRLMPRILDVLNGYLRALETREITQPGTHIRLRAQMLRRVQIVTGEGHVRDLLITEFVLN